LLQINTTSHIYFITSFVDGTADGTPGLCLVGMYYTTGAVPPALNVLLTLETGSHFMHRLASNHEPPDLSYRTESPPTTGVGEDVGKRNPLTLLVGM
jgi:hypothetical protein